MNKMIKSILIAFLLLVVIVNQACASGISYEPIDLEEIVAGSSFIVQAEYLGEGRDDHGPHANYRLKKVIYAAKKEICPDLKVWAAHAEAWGMAMRLARDTGENNWFSVPEYRGKGRIDEPEKGKSYLLLLKQLAREADFGFHAEGALLDERMINEISSLLKKTKKWKN